MTLHAVSHLFDRADEKIVWVNVPKEVEKAIVEISDGGQSDLDRLSSNFYQTKIEAEQELTDERSSSVGLCAKDFMVLAYPRLNDTLRDWWVKTDVVYSPPKTMENHIVFVTSKLYFPWHLLPLRTGQAIGMSHSVSVAPKEKFAEVLLGNDGVLFSRGKLKRAEASLYDEIPGSGLKRQFAIFGSGLKFWKRGKYDLTTEKEMIARCNADGVLGYELENVEQISCRVIGKNETQLPSVWFHEGHGHEYGLELNSNKDGEVRMMSEKDISEHLKSTKGTVEFAWISSCHSIELAARGKWLEQGKVTTMLGHIGMGDESEDNIAFEMLVLCRLKQGVSIGHAVHLAKKALDPEMPASGSYALIGDPRLKFVN